jgi:hypothetical protein
MNETEIIEILEKVQSRCARLLEWYQQNRVNSGWDHDASQCGYSEASHSLTRLLSMLHALPAKPLDAVQDPGRRRQVTALLGEVSELLERAIVADREMRGELSGHPAAMAAAPEPAGMTGGS